MSTLVALGRADVIEQVRARTDIVAVISEYVDLKRSGGNYSGLCPFHGEKTASFSVSREKGLFYCFGCQEHGNVFHFVEKMEGISFPEALERLAERAGIELPSQGAHYDDAMRARQVAYGAYTAAGRFYHQALMREGADAARSYLIGRGITSEDVVRFRIGYAPDAWTSLVDALVAVGYEKDYLVDIGLASRAQTGDSVFDKLRNRAVFPIFDERRRVVGFGARSMDGSQPKYLNSPESLIFSKGKCLYGLTQARDAIRADSRAVLVEGYMDVIACHRAGASGAVASLGTSLTREQARMLARLAKEVILCYDGDSAGVAATVKAFQTLTAEGLQVRVARMEAAKDPDELVKVRGADALMEVLDKSSSVVDWRLDTLAGEFDFRSPEGRIQAVGQVVPLLASMANAVECGEYTKLVASRLQVAASAVEQEVRKARAAGQTWVSSADTPRHARDILTNNAGRSVPAGSSAGLPVAVVSAERELIALMLDNADMLEVVQKSLGLMAFRVEVHREVVAALFEQVLLSPEGPVELPSLLGPLGDEARALVSRLAVRAVRAEPGADSERIFIDCANKVREYQLLEEMDSLGREAEDHDAAGRADEADQCLRRLKFLVDRLEREFHSPQV